MAKRDRAAGLTMREMAIKVLGMASAPMSAIELWRFAEQKQITPRTAAEKPWQSLSALLSRDKKETFIHVGSGPVKYWLRERTLPKASSNARQGDGAKPMSRRPAGITSPPRALPEPSAAPAGGQTVEPSSNRPLPGQGRLEGDEPHQTLQRVLSEIGAIRFGDTRVKRADSQDGSRLTDVVWLGKMSGKAVAAFEIERQPGARIDGALARLRQTRRDSTGCRLFLFVPDDNLEKAKDKASTNPDMEGILKILTIEECPTDAFLLWLHLLDEDSELQRNW